MNNLRYIQTLLLALVLVSAPLTTHNDALAAGAVDCAAVMASLVEGNCSADPDDLLACQNRGWDPPTKCRPGEGVGSGVKESGSGAFEHPKHAPEAPPGAIGSPASVSRKVIQQACNFPPRITDITRTRGSCLDFFNNLFKDKDGGTYDTPPPPPISPEIICPIEADATGVYGVKQSIATGGTVPLACGGMVPTNTIDVVLNAKATMLAITANSYQIQWYRKAGDRFVLAGVRRLPTFLCREKSGGGRKSSVNLTPPVQQAITYDPSVRRIAIRLKSRETMNPGFKPPYDETAPERYLVLPLDSRGNPVVPSGCPLARSFYLVPSAMVPPPKQDIQIQPQISGECETVSLGPIADGEITCPDGSTRSDTDGNCHDNTTGNIVGEVFITSSACYVPPGAPADLSKPDPITGKCPLQTLSGLPDPSPAECALDSVTSIANCDAVSIKPDGEACASKTQYAILDQPTIHYPTGSSPKFYPVEGRTSVMAETTNGSTLYAQTSTLFILQRTAPPLTFNEGGFITLNNDNILIMKQPATVAASTATVTLTGGGQLVSSGGVQLQSFQRGEVYTIPATYVKYPMEVRAGRSVIIPAGFMIPTIQKIGPQLPYVRLPAETEVQ